MLAHRSTRTTEGLHTYVHYREPNVGFIDRCPTRSESRLKLCENDGESRRHVNKSSIIRIRRASAFQDQRLFEDTLHDLK